MNSWKSGKLETRKTRPQLSGRTFFFYFLIFSFSISLAQTIEVERRVFDIARQLRCPVCTSESVANSAGDTSVEMRNIIQEQVEAGRSDAEILAFFQERYGDWILLSPPKRGLHLFVWVLPVVAAIIGVAVLALIVRRWTARSSEVVELDDTERQRVREAMESG